MPAEGELTTIALVILAALVGGLAFARLKQPPIIGYILAGILLGPSGFAFIYSRDPVSILAELGVLLLLFVVGMDLSLRTFKKVWWIATLSTIIQLSLCIGISLSVASFFGWSPGLALLIGFVGALSSTAVSVKILESFDELKTDLGQITIGILIAQDLAIIPMILLLRNHDKSWLDFSLITKIVLSTSFIVLLINYLSRRQRVRLPLTQIIAGEKDLTPLASLTFCFGASALSGLMGLSAAYGAFLAGLVLGNTHERTIMLETTRPIQSILMMAFFLSIGLLLDLNFVANNLGVVVLLLIILTLGKTFLNIFVIKLLRLPWPQAFFIGTVISQLGEFSFLLTTVAYQTHIINDFGQNLLISLTVLSLGTSPLWLWTAKRVKMLFDGQSINLKAVMRMLYGVDVHKIKNSYRKVLQIAKHPNPSDKRKNSSETGDESVNSQEERKD